MDFFEGVGHDYHFYGNYAIFITTIPWGKPDVTQWISIGFLIFGMRCLWLVTLRKTCAASIPS